MDNPIKILLADDHKIFREGFKLMFSRNEKIKLADVASDGKKIIEMTGLLSPDVILMDIEMPVMNGIEATRTLSKSHPQIGIIALSSFDEEIKIKAMLDAGAKGYLLKDADEQEVQLAIEEVYHGRSYYSKSISERLNMPDFIDSESINCAGIRFTKKEIQVMQLMCDEYSTKQIAAEMKLKPRTIDWYRDGLIPKTGSKTSAGIICFALRNKIDQFLINS
jgi:DNA-binding NarL/FixJ family response regulator